MPLNLENCYTNRVPLRYGSDRCCIVLTDSRFTPDIVALRNDPSVNRFIHHEDLTNEAHEQWLARESGRRDSLNFVVLVERSFAGTASLYDIEVPHRCQYGRVVMPADERRIFAVTTEFLCLSFAFEVLQLQEVYCRVAEENRSVYEFHLHNGWKPNAKYDGRLTTVEGEAAQLGMSMDGEDWRQALDKNRVLLRRLHAPLQS